MKSRLLLGPFLFAALLSSVFAAAPSQNTQGKPSINSSSSGVSGTEGTAAAAADTVTVAVPMVVLVPIEVRSDPNLANGCWVRLSDGTNFKGKDELTIAGPMEMQTLQTPSGINWRRKADSLLVGPKATVQIYENSMFKDKTKTFQPGQQVPSLRKELGFLHSIDSLKITCAK
jgi:hypothetical protein